jgi:hypothetical protein
VKVEKETALTHWLEGRNLPEGRSVEAFKQAVQHQLVKDFQWDAERVGEVRISLLQLLEDEINWGMDRNPTGLFACFYRLDLGEVVIREVMDWNERPQAAAKLAELSLERAAQKVWLRWTFGAVDSATG